jgi:hypothetical protein
MALSSGYATGGESSWPSGWGMLVALPWGMLMALGWAMLMTLPWGKLMALGGEC